MRLTCSFCGTPHPKLHAGRGARICRPCVRRLLPSAQQRGTEVGPHPEPCSFCGARQTYWIWIGVRGANICDLCVIKVANALK